MFLTKLTINAASREFRRDYADVQHMHRTIMSGYSDHAGDGPARQAHGVLWRLDPVHHGFTLYVQSRTKPDWTRLAPGYLQEPAQVRDHSSIIEAIQPGRKLAFRLVANPTRAQAATGEPGQRVRGKRLAQRDPEKQIEWLARQGERHGFVIPLGVNGKPDIAPSPTPVLQGNKTAKKPITVQPVRYDGHLIITDSDAFATALHTGIGPAKAYGCGLFSLAPARNA